jgi:tetratricopeptide (TPR) repeat protein
MGCHYEAYVCSNKRLYHPLCNKKREIEVYISNLWQKLLYISTIVMFASACPSQSQMRTTDQAKHWKSHTAQQQPETSHATNTKFKGQRSPGSTSGRDQSIDPKLNIKSSAHSIHKPTTHKQLELGAISPSRDQLRQSTEGSEKREVQAKTNKRFYVSANAYRYYLEGRLHALAKRQDQALRAYKMALVFDPISTYLHYCITQQYLELKNWKAAYIWAKKTLERDANHAKAYYLLGQIEANLSQWQKAANYYRTAIQKDPQLKAAYVALDEIWQHTNIPFTHRISLFEQMVQKLPRQYEGYLRLGQLFELQGDYQRSINYYRQTINHKPSQTTALYRLAKIYVHKQMWNQAIKMFRIYLDYQPEDWQVRAELAASHLRRSRPHDRELAEFQLRLVMDTETTTELNKRALYVGQTLHHSELHNQAITWFKRVLSLGNKNLRAMLFLGITYRMLKKSKKALDILSIIPSDQRDLYIDARSQMIEIKMSLARYTEARSIVQQIRNTYPQQIEWWIRLSQAYVEHATEADLRHEVKSLQSKVHQYPRHERLLYQLAYAHFKLQEYAIVESLLQRVLSHNAQNFSAMNFLAYIYAVQGTKLIRAEQLVRRALDSEPGNAYFLDSLGWVLYRRGRYQEALQILHKAQKITPKEAAILYHLGRTYAQIGQHHRALQFYQRARELAPPIDMLGQIDLAIRNLQTNTGKNQ